LGNLQTQTLFNMKGLLLKIWRKLGLSTNLQLFFMRRTNDQFLIGVTGIFLDAGKQILLVKHSYRGNGTWSLPGGYLKKGEHPQEGLEREVKEETGFEVSADRRLKIRTDRDSARLDITYAGRFIGGVFTPSKEITDARLFSFDNLPLLAPDQLSFIQKALKK
jgi:8-oxo-dGTP diphosphatase